MIDGPISVLRVRREPGGVWVMDDHMSLINYIGVSAAFAILAGPKFHPGGYLATVGPAPLRYRAPAIAPEMVIPLPPLAMTNDTPRLKQTALEQITTNEPPVSVTVTAEPATNVTQTVVLPMDSDPFTARMFVQFFNQLGTNNPVSIIAPVPFTPPATTIPPPPSRATYEIK